MKISCLFHVSGFFENIYTIFVSFAVLVYLVILATCAIRHLHKANTITEHFG